MSRIPAGLPRVVRYFAAMSIETWAPGRLLRLRALAEVLLIAWLGKYLVTRGVFVGAGDIAFFGWIFEGDQELLASAVARSIAVWVIYLGSLVLLFRSRIIRDLFANLLAPAARPGWIFAVITASMQITILTAFYIRDVSLIWEPSLFNLYMSLATAIGGGVGEELLYRGYILTRLKAGGLSPTVQVLVSGALFGLAHVSWSAAQSGAGLVQVLSPVVGTFLLGALFARAFQLSGYRLLPVVIAHGAINLVIEPALILSYFTG